VPNAQALSPAMPAAERQLSAACCQQQSGCYYCIAAGTAGATTGAAAGVLLPALAPAALQRVWLALLLEA